MLGRDPSRLRSCLLQTRVDQRMEAERACRVSTDDESSEYLLLNSVNRVVSNNNPPSVDDIRC